LATIHGLKKLTDITKIGRVLDNLWITWNIVEICFIFCIYSPWYVNDNVKIKPTQ
jgi:hypothetical protein